MSDDPEPYSFIKNFPDHAFLHDLEPAAVTATEMQSDPPRSSVSVKNAIRTSPAIIFSDGQADDQQGLLMWHHCSDRDPTIPLTVVAGRQWDGWDTFKQQTSFTDRLQRERENRTGALISADVFRGEGFQIIRGGPMGDPTLSGKGLTGSELQAARQDDERLSREAADRVSHSIDGPYIAHVWTSLNTFSRMSDAAKERCKGLVFTCAITLQSDRFSAGWNMAADLRSWKAAHDYCKAHDIPLVLVRGRLLGTEINHQFSFAKGDDGYDHLLMPEVKLHPDDKASFDRVKEKTMSENLEQLCGALAFLKGDKTMTRPQFKEGSTLNRLISQQAWTEGWAINPDSVILPWRIAGNNPYTSDMGDPFALTLSHPDVQLVPVTVNTDDPGNIVISPLEDSEKAITYLAVAPTSFHDIFAKEHRPPINVYKRIAGSEDARVPLVDEAAASEWLEYCDVMCGLLEDCREALNRYFDNDLTVKQKDIAWDTYRILRDEEFFHGTMTRVSKHVRKSA